MKRKKEITTRFLQLLDGHLDDIMEGTTSDMMRLHEIASELCVSYQHLSDVVKQTTGHSPGHFYDVKIIEKSKKMLEETNFSVARIALILTYDPSNFSKFFKKRTGQTPGQYRN